MALSMDIQIQKCDILQIRSLSDGHPVFLLKGRGTDQLVVKVEVQATRESFGQVMKAMTWAMPRTSAQRVLSKAEKQAITQWISENVASGTGGQSDFIRSLFLGSGKFGPIKDTADTVMVKMPVATMQTLDTYSDKFQVAKAHFAAALSGGPGWEQLGRVAAADLFNSNTDRFSPFDPDSVLANKGNLIITQGATDGSYDVSGMDPYHGGSGFRPDRSLNEEGQRYPGVLLGDKAKAERDVFVRRVVSELEQLLGATILGKACGRFFHRRVNGDRQAHRQFEGGLLDGADAIKAGIEREFLVKLPIKQRYERIWGPLASRRQGTPIGSHRGPART